MSFCQILAAKINLHFQDRLCKQVSRLALSQEVGGEEDGLDQLVPVVDQDVKAQELPGSLLKSGSISR